jgi:bifunctional DNA-binding transcriptional regulator/antitoxin component of YhaV-PrlF toxin-antitoxin module
MPARLSAPIVIRSKISPGYRVEVPYELRRKFAIGVGDEVVWILEGDYVKADFRKMPSLERIGSLGASGRNGASAVRSKKRVQEGMA